MFKAFENKDKELFLNGHNIICFQGILQKGTRDILITQQLDRQFSPSYLGLTGLTREGIPSAHPSISYISKLF